MDIHLNCPIPFTDSDRVLLAHGGGGRMTHQLISQVFYPAFRNPLLEQDHDGCVFLMEEGRLAYSTDSFVVDPIFFPGGDIGDLAINGTVNDLACCGARPLYLTAGFYTGRGLASSRSSAYRTIHETCGGACRRTDRSRGHKSGGTGQVR